MKPFLLLLTTLFVSSAWADKRKDDKQPTVPFCPSPDVVQPLPAHDRPLPHIAEVMLRAPRFVPTLCGIDVSHYQGAINWQMASIDSSVRYVYIKATESSDLVDSHFQHNVLQAQKYGIPTGVYHFFRPTASAPMQFANFSRNVAGLPMNLIPIVDVEKRGKVSLSVFQNRLSEFLNLVEKLFGAKPIIYTGVNFYNKYLAGKFREYKFMIARYGEDVPTLCEPVPIVMWQFTDKGSVNGVHGNVDRSCFVGKYGLQDIVLPQKPEGKKK